MEVDKDQLKRAVRKRKAYFLQNLETMTMKECRAVLEQDMHLAASALKQHKDYVNELIDKLVLKQAAEAAPEEGGPPAQKRARKADAAGPPKAAPARPAKAAAKPAPAKESAAAPAYGPRVERLRRLCRAATIAIPPNVYRAAKAGGGEAALAAALEALLAKHGLGKGSDRAATDAVRARLQLQKDLDGMDMANIVEGGRRRGAARPSFNYAAMTASDSDDSEQLDSAAEEGDENRTANRLAPARRALKAKGAAKQGKKEAAEESESDGGSDSGSGAEPSASASGSEFAVDGAGEHEEEGEGAAQARRQEGEEEEAAQEASGSEDGSGEAAPGSKTALQPSRSPASEKAGPRKRVLVLSDDED